MRRQLTPNELDNLFRSIGRNIWYIQYLEDLLHTLLTLKIEIKKPGQVTKDEARKLLEKHRRATLGTALQVAEKNKALADDILQGLRRLKEDRDWMVHRSMHQDGDLLYTTEGRNSLFMRLEQIMEKTRLLKVQVYAEITAFCSSHGISTVAAESIARQRIDKLKGEG